MRTYVFTDRERGIINEFLEGARSWDVEVSKIWHRITHFKELEQDVELYLKFRKKQASSSPKSRFSK